jgi:hypothetical protein
VNKLDIYSVFRIHRLPVEVIVQFRDLKVVGVVFILVMGVSRFFIELRVVILLGRIKN